VRLELRRVRLFGLRRVRELPRQVVQQLALQVARHLFVAGQYQNTRRSASSRRR
jgi:hypothetical protein